MRIVGIDNEKIMRHKVFFYGRGFKIPFSGLKVKNFQMRMNMELPCGESFIEEAVIPEFSETDCLGQTGIDRRIERTLDITDIK